MPREARARESRSRALSWPRRIVYSLLPLLLLVALLESAFRAFPREDVGRTRSGIVEPDPDLIWRLARRPGSGVEINELGLRDAPFDRDAEHRILLLGDSVSWCDSIDDLRRCFPYLLERALERRDPARRVEIVNSGVPGYSTFQQLRYLELRGLALEPDGILLQFCLNDVVERYGTVAAYGGDNVFLGVDTREPVRGLFGMALRSSRAFEALVRWLQGSARNREAYRVGRLASPRLAPELEAAWRVTLGELDGIRRVADEHDIPLLLLIAPYRFQMTAPEHTRQPQDRLITWAQVHDVPWLDLLPIFASQPEPETLFLDASHFSPRGHGVASEALVEPVRTRLLGDGSRRRAAG